MRSRAECYRELAVTCAETVYGTPVSMIRRHNDAVDGMRALVSEAAAVGPAAVAELFPLLTDPLTVRWLTFQLVELCQLTETETQLCLGIIREIATDSGVEALGSQIWLKERGIPTDL